MVIRISRLCAAAKARCYVNALDGTDWIRETAYHLYVAGYALCGIRLNEIHRVGLSNLLSASRG